MNDQHLPTYKHDFLKDPRWKTRESAHYIFNYFPSSVAEKDIETIVQTQEAAYEKIVAFLELPPPQQKITYYFYPDEKTKIALMGDDWYAQAIRAEWRIHVLYTEKDKPLGPHEDTHLLSLPWGISIGFFQEGLAEYMVGHAWDGKSHQEYVKEGYRQNMYPPLKTFFEHEAWMKTDDSKPLYFYSLAGAFTRFLIELFGKEKFAEFYKLSNRKLSGQNLEVFEQLYGDVGELENQFKNSLT